MATTDRSATEPETADGPAAIARAVREAGFCHLLARADGDGLAAAATLASACAALGTPYQVATVRTAGGARTRRAAADPEATTVGVGIDDAAHNGPVLNGDPSLAVAAARAVERLDGVPAPDPVPVLAGAASAGVAPGTAGDGLLERAGLERRPGVAIPTDDVADGLAHTTLAWTPWGGDVEAARAGLAELGFTDATEDARRRLASWLAVRVAGAPERPDRAATAIERALRPYPIDAPVATVGGYADVLDACARRAPGLGVALAAGRPVCEAALEAWRAHGGAVHAALADATFTRHPGLSVARVEAGPVEAVARLARDFHAPEPAVLAIAADGTAGLATTDRDAGDALAGAVGDLDGYAAGPTGFATGPSDGTDHLVEAVREVFGA